MLDGYWQSTDASTDFRARPFRSDKAERVQSDTVSGYCSAAGVPAERSGSEAAHGPRSQSHPPQSYSPFPARPSPLPCSTAPGPAGHGHGGPRVPQAWCKRIAMVMCRRLFEHLSMTVRRPFDLISPFLPLSLPWSRRTATATFAGVREPAEPVLGRVPTRI